MREPIEELYFNWLCAKVLERSHNRNYYDLLEILHRTEFVWVVPADEHRADDRIELRQDFIRETGAEKEPEWWSQPCSVLELFISFAKRASFQTDDPVKHWFWEFLGNLKLDEFRRVSGSDFYKVEDILYNFIWRLYEPNGYGGLFPLEEPKADQRQVEIWYQFCAYVLERGLI
jgi:hypothetical protein